MRPEIFSFRRFIWNLLSSAEHRGDPHGDSCARYPATDQKGWKGFGGFFVCSLHEYRIVMDSNGWWWWIVTSGRSQLANNLQPPRAPPPFWSDLLPVALARAEILTVVGTVLVNHGCCITTSSQLMPLLWKSNEITRILV
jgi:hypothetical protein